MRMPRPLLPVLIALSFLVSINAQDKPESERVESPKELKALKYRSIGPAAGGRVSRATGVPGNPLVYYAATASGGVWMSSDGGTTWKSIFDKQPVSSIGSIAVAPSDATTIYVGSGEANIRGNVGAGNGIYKSTDAREDVDTRLGSAGADRHDGRAPEERRHRIRRGSGPCLRTEPRAWRVSNEGRRKDLAAGAEEGRRHGRVRCRDRSDQPFRRLRGPLAGTAVSMGSAERRPWQRTLRLARRRRHMEAAHRPRPSRRHLGQGRRGRRAVERPAGLRAHRSRKGRAVSIRRRRRELGAGQSVARAAPAGVVLHRRSP